MKLCVFKDTPTRIPITRLNRLFEMFVQAEANPDWSSVVNLVFTTDHKIRNLNREFRSVDRATDVLSFNMDEPSESGGTFGEIYISVHTATRQAGEYGVTLFEEFLRLACHGLLHLSGYDHVDSEDNERMRKFEKQLLDRLGESGEHV